MVCIEDPRLSSLQAKGIVHDFSFAHLQGEGVGTINHLSIGDSEDIGMEFATLEGASVDRLVIIKVYISYFVVVNVYNQVRALTGGRQSNTKSSGVSVLSIVVLNCPGSCLGLSVIPGRSNDV